MPSHTLLPSHLHTALLQGARQTRQAWRNRRKPAMPLPRRAALLAVLAAPKCDIGLIGYEMALLVARTGEVLTPELRAELQAALPR